MHWVLLIFAIAFEVTGQTFLKMSYGLTKFLPAFLAICFMPTSFLIYAFALKKINISMAYAMWSGLGTAAMVIIGGIVFKEHISMMRILFITLIITGIAGLHLSK